VRHFFLILAPLRSLGRDVGPLSLHRLLETVAKRVRKLALRV